MQPDINYDNIWEYIKSIPGIADICFALILVGLLIFLGIRFKFSKVAVIILSLLLASLFITAIFNLRFSSYILLMYITGTMFILCLAHIGSIRSLISKIGKRSSLNKKHGFGKFVDRDALYNEIYETVAACSRQKIGALITFEKHDDLSNLTKNGTIVNAPVTRELLMTIFYPGTRLHDGAVIIKDNMIYAASVYYTPTTKALSGKYGSRHRAAIGISEMSDSVTIVVSEETGRISIAQGGELDSVLIDEFVENLAERINRGE